MSQPADIPGVTHRFVQAGDIRMHIAEAGQGPLVLLLHGFPESWYSWRHQLTALAEAGYHAVAPDQRGYCETGPPQIAGRAAEISDYSILHLTGDVLALMDALGADRAVVAGHDWGAPVAWHAGLFRPDRVAGVIALSVAYRPRGSSAPIATLRSLLGESFYMVYFQEPGVADAELAHAPMLVPAIFVAGDRDPVISFLPPRDLAAVVPKLTESIMLPGCGHWTQQERPAEVNTAMLSFLRGLGPY
jgi:pimeloyl-ACP methyl ester carboxylesterase